MVGRKHERVNFFLDSGAFSAMTQKAEINIDEYIQFIRDNGPSIAMYANLDVIGDAVGTHKNLKYMEDKGMKPLPVYHAGEPFSYLEEYVNGYDYICLGGAAGRLKTQEQVMRWLDVLWDKYLTKDDGFAKIKVHGFGITSFPLLLRYPWESVDSTSWVQSAAYGNIFVPRPDSSGNYSYDKPPFVVCVSDKSPSMKIVGQHYRTFTPAVQDYIRGYIEHMGLTIKECEEHYVPRCELNVVYFMDFADNKPPTPFKRKARGFFDMESDV